jgi:hypothetical protein
LDRRVADSTAYGSLSTRLVALGRTEHSVVVRSRSRRRWSELDPRIRCLILVSAAFEGVLKVAALIDLGRRPSAEVRGSKARWAAAIVLINSAGAAPLAYFRYGRRRVAEQG